VKPSEIREKTGDELVKKARDLEEEIFRLKFRASTAQLKQTANIKKARKDLARVKTVAREREIAESKGGK
jgi:large subunit ribosomal protein L29